jgi:hypothetical protein
LSSYPIHFLNRKIATLGQSHLSLGVARFVSDSLNPTSFIGSMHSFLLLPTWLTTLTGPAENSVGLQLHDCGQDIFRVALQDLHIRSTDLFYLT